MTEKATKQQYLNNLNDTFEVIKKNKIIKINV